ncbi:MAG TPA: hypothetical protein VF184_08920 [Phycisphaeraceae bacterium]
MIGRSVNSNGCTKKNRQGLAAHTAAMTQRQGRPVVSLRSDAAGTAAALSAQDGAELCSLEVFDQGRWRQLLYRGGDWRPVDGWAGRAPWLWPVAGRAYADPRDGLTDRDRCTWRWQGRVLPIPQHGLVRHLAWKLRHRSATEHHASCSAELAHGPTADYPFASRLRVSLEVGGPCVQMTLEVQAGDNPHPMPFHAGNHLTFDLRDWWGPRWLEGVIEGLGPVAWTTDALMQADRCIDLPQRPLPLTDARLASALIPAGASPRVRLIGPDGAKRLDLLFSARSSQPDGLLWVTYLDPQKRFFCCEPWVGWPNAINTGRGRVDLPPRQTWAFEIKIQWHAARSAADRSDAARLAGPSPLMPSPVAAGANGSARPVAQAQRRVPLARSQA